MVEVERSIFAIPLSTVIEAVRISRSEIKTINGREVLHLRDRVLPLICLAQEFDIRRIPIASGFTWSSPRWETAGWGVVVDELRSQEEVVIKSIWDYLETVKGRIGRHDHRRRQGGADLDTSELVQNAQAWHNPVSPPDTRSAP